MTQSEPNDAAQGRNFERALDAHAAVRMYAAIKDRGGARITGLFDFAVQSPEEWLTDLLTDLRHWTREEGIDFERVDAMARSHFECETDEEEDPDEPPASRAVEDELAEIGAQVPPEEWAKVGAEERLGEAAPELLEACKAALLLAGDGDLPDNGEYGGAAITDQIRAAVAKAEGADPGAAGRGDVVTDLLRACKVVSLDRRIRAWLAENDPKALAQVEAAIRKAEGGGV